MSAPLFTDEPDRVTRLLRTHDSMASMYCAGARLEANYPISVITDGMGLNITVMSCCGHLDFGLIADRDQIPDLDRLIGWLGEALDELKP